MDLKKQCEVAKWHFGGKQNHKQKTSNKQHRTLISYNSDGLQIRAETMSTAIARGRIEHKMTALQLARGRFKNTSAIFLGLLALKRQRSRSRSRRSKRRRRNSSQDRSEQKKKKCYRFLQIFHQKSLSFKQKGNKLVSYSEIHLFIIERWHKMTYKNLIFLDFQAILQSFREQ